jgi:hypothetical protein
MNWEAVGSAGEIISAVAVVTSLIYLAVQLRTNSRTIKASAAWDAETIFTELNRQAAHDAEISALSFRYSSPEARIEDFNDIERTQIWFILLSVFQATQAQYFMWKEDCLSVEVWSYRLTWLRNFLLLPVVRSNWDQMKSQYLLSPDFVVLVEIEEGGEVYTQTVRSNSTQESDDIGAGT